MNTNSHDRTNHLFRRGKGSRKGLDEFNYKVNMNETMPQRLVSFLLWAAKHMPERFTALNVIARILLQLKDTPKIDSHYVMIVKRVQPNAKRILKRSHHATIETKRGVGIRATIDDEDLAKVEFERDARGMARAIERMDETREAIRLSEIRTPALRDRVIRLGNVTKILTSSEVLDKLRLPGPDKKKTNHK
jgi:hypothetical protein